MEVRYRADWKSMDGTQYRIDVMDYLYPPGATATPFEIGIDSGDGFTISYEADENDITSRIFGSKCSVNIVVNDSSFENFIEEMANAQEGRFFIQLYKYDGLDYQRIWAGIVLNDMLSYEDLHFPYTFQLIAVDSLARLKNLTYPGVWEKAETMLQYILNFLNQLETSQFWGSSDVILRTSINWYADSMFTTTPDTMLDPLSVSEVLNNAFRTIDTKGNVTDKSYYEILDQICLLWNARMFMADGVFWFVQISELLNSSIVVRNYAKDGSVISTDAAYNIEVALTSREGIFQFFMPLLESNITYAYKQYMPQANRLPSQSDYAVEINLGMMAGGSDETLVFSGSVNLSMVDSGTTVENHLWHFKMKIQIGNYYLKSNGGIYEWVTDSTARVDIYSGIYHDYNYTDSVIINFTTEKIPALGDSNFSFYFVQYEDGAGNTISIPDTAAGSFSCSNFDLKQTGEKGTAIYTAVNPTTGSLSEKSLPELYLGDGASIQSDGRIIVKDTSGAWVVSKKEWTVGGTGTPVFINQLLVNDVLALQQKARRIYQGRILKTTFWPFNNFLIGGKKYTLLSGSWNANRNEWEGSFHELSKS